MVLPLNTGYSLKLDLWWQSITCDSSINLLPNFLPASWTVFLAVFSIFSYFFLHIPLTIPSLVCPCITIFFLPLNQPFFISFFPFFSLVSSIFFPYSLQYPSALAPVLPSDLPSGFASTPPSALPLSHLVCLCRIAAEIRIRHRFLESASTSASVCPARP